MNDHFASIKDVRDRRGFCHELKEIVAIAILVTIYGADEYTKVEELGKSRKGFFVQIMKLKNGIPAYYYFW